MSRHAHASARRTRPRLAAAMVVASTAVGAVAAPTVASAAPPLVITEVNHFDRSQYFPPDPDCWNVGMTERAVGTEHFHATDMGPYFHVVYGETYRITVTFDDGRPDEHRKGTDVWQLQVPKNGNVQVFHESYHDHGSPFGNIQLYTTFVVVNGEVVVDHEIRRNEPHC